MTHRRRALAFAAGAAVCALAAALVVSGYADRYRVAVGAGVPVVVAAAEIPAERTIGPRRAASDLRVRRIPERFAPAGALGDPTQAIGLAPAASIPAGSPLLAGSLIAPEDEGAVDPALGRGRRPVEIVVTGGAALAAFASDTRADVIVSRDTGGRAGTVVAERNVAVLDLRPADPAVPLEGADAATPAGSWIATLALTRRQAVGLIEAERTGEVRLLARPSH